MPPQAVVLTTKDGDYVKVDQSTKDSQRTRLYRAETLVRERHPEFAIGVGRTPEQRGKMCQKFVDDVLKRKYVQRKYLTGPINVWVKQGAWRWAHAQGSNIDLPSGGAWSFNKMVLLHEVAHVFERRMNGQQMSGHGWTFAAIFLDLVRNVCGKEVANELKAEYKWFKVKFRQPRKRSMSTDQRDAAAARLEKARAARDKKLAPQREFRDKVMAQYKRINTGKFWQNGPHKGKAIWKHKLGDMTIEKSPMNMSHAAREELWDRFQKFERERHGPPKVTSSRDPYDFYGTGADSFKNRFVQEYSRSIRPTHFSTITDLTS